MLYEFLKSNRLELVARCRASVTKRRAPTVSPAELEYGIPLFLDQLTEMLPGGTHANSDREPTPLRHPSMLEQQMHDAATRHGGELLRHDFTIEQVVHDYGDLCQAITQLASEKHAPISTQEFGVLNIQLDNAIAGAVTEFARRTRDESSESAASLSALVHELRNLHNTSIVAITAIRHGTVGFGGATSVALDQSMARIGTLLDRAISQVGSRG